MEHAAYASLRALRMGDVGAAERRKVATWLRFANQPDVTALLGLAWFRERELWTDSALAVSLFSAVFEGSDWSLAFRMASHHLCDATIRTLGSARHEDTREHLRAGHLTPAFAFSELGGGVMTRATFDRRTNAFQLNSPSTGASKFCVPLECDVAIVFARLFVDAVDKGIHAFLVPVRLADKSVAPGVRFGELATTGGAPPGLRCGWLRFYDMPLSRTALLNRLGDVDSKPASVRQLLAPLRGTRVLALSGATTALAHAVRVAQRFALEPRGHRAMTLEFATVQTTLMSSHATLLAAQLMRNHIVAALADDSRAAAVFSDACATHYTRQCLASIDALAMCVGASSLVAASGFPTLLRDSRALLFVAGHPSAPLQALAQWLIKGYTLRYGGFAGALRYFARKLSLWMESNPVASRRTSVAYLRSAAFQMRCLKYRVFALCTSLMEDVTLANGAEMGGAAWRATVDGAEQLARAFVELQTHKLLLRIEASASEPRLIAVLQRCRSLLALQWIADWGVEYRNEGYVSVAQSRAIEIERGVVARELLVDSDVLLGTSRDAKPLDEPATHAERLIKAKL